MTEAEVKQSFWIVESSISADVLCHDVGHFILGSLMERKEVRTTWELGMRASSLKD